MAYRKQDPDAPPRQPTAQFLAAYREDLHAYGFTSEESFALVRQQLADPITLHVDPAAIERVIAAAADRVEHKRKIRELDKRMAEQRSSRVRIRNEGEPASASSDADDA